MCMDMGMGDFHLTSFVHVLYCENISVYCKKILSNIG